MSDIALTVSVLALVAVVGLWIGNIKIRGVGFGIGGVLFGGIIVGHFADSSGWCSAPKCCTLFRNSA
jgi:putative transport protein